MWLRVSLIISMLLGCDGCGARQTEAEWILTTWRYRIHSCSKHCPLQRRGRTVIVGVVQYQQQLRHLSWLRTMRWNHNDGEYIRDCHESRWGNNTPWKFHLQKDSFTIDRLVTANQGGKGLQDAVRSVADERVITLYTALLDVVIWLMATPFSSTWLHRMSLLFLKRDKLNVINGI